ncbi:hypothetical protein Tco_0452251 [Tanacetum coccineum]
MVIPDLWYRYLTMMQERECHIYQAYSAMDPHKRIEGDKFLHFHFKKMQKMKMHLMAVKDIQLKVQPFAKAGTTFVPKEPDKEGEKLDGCFMKGPYPDQILTTVGVDANNGIYPGIIPEGPQSQPSASQSQPSATQSQGLSEAGITQSQTTTPGTGSSQVTGPSKGTRSNEGAGSSQGARRFSPRKLIKKTASRFSPSK